MENYKRILATIFIMFSWSTLVYAQKAGVEWDDLNQQVFDLYQQGEYSRTLVVGQQALELAIQNAGPDHYDVATSLENLVHLYRETKRIEEVEKLEYARPIFVQ